MHTVANALSFALLSPGFVTVSGPLGAILSPGTEGLAHAILFALVGLGLYRYRTRPARTTAQPKLTTPALSA